MTPDQLNVLIASPLEPEHVARIEAADPRVSVLYEPSLLPVPRYAADHGGLPRELSASQLERWDTWLSCRIKDFLNYAWQNPKRR